LRAEDFPVTEDDKYKTVWSDREMVLALHEALGRGHGRDVVHNYILPPNLCGFYNNLPKPERDRLLGLAESAGPS
jgi:hypothetical protein